jgi:hypothetical protein
MTVKSSSTKERVWDIWDCSLWHPILAQGSSSSRWRFGGLLSPMFLIVARFIHFNDLQYVLNNAYRFRNTAYGIQQFPREIEDRRRELYPIQKEAKGQGKRVAKPVNIRFFFMDRHWRSRIEFCRVFICPWQLHWLLELSWFANALSWSETFAISDLFFSQYDFKISNFFQTFIKNYNYLTKQSRSFSWKNIINCQAKITDVENSVQGVGNWMCIVNVTR